jgi:hypothetical protein
VQELEVVLEVLERGADGVQTPGFGHRLHGCGQRRALVFPATTLDEDAPVPAATAASPAAAAVSAGGGADGAGEGAGGEGRRRRGWRR